MTQPPTRAVAAAFPDLAGIPLQPLGAGFDCRSWLAGTFVVKEPLHPAAAEALAREARVLQVLHGKIHLAIPRPQHAPGPPALSRHDLLPGQHLTPDLYDTLSAPARDHLAQDLARFHAECHAVPAADLRAAGAQAVQPWPETVSTAIQLLPPALRGVAQRLLAEWTLLSPDPWGEVWGHFDAHGWNMAFDPVAKRLQGIYDFGDSGFGPLHRDLIYSALISFDLTLRLGRAYEARTGKRIDPMRLRCLSGAHRLWELAEAPAADRPWLVQAFQRWCAQAQ